MKVAVLVHHPLETLGKLEKILLRRNYEITQVDTTQNAPELDDFGFVIGMGGPMSVNDATDWIIAEKAAVKKYVDSGGHYLGVCFGAQMLISAYGGEIFPSPVREAGHSTAKLTKEGIEDVDFGKLPETLEVFQFHGEAFSLPPVAKLLASTRYASEIINQAFRINNAYGLLFHWELSYEMALSWADEFAQELKAARVTRQHFLNGFLNNRDLYLMNLLEFMNGYLDKIEARAA